MNILAIQTGHNATIALLRDGVITSVLSQEKLDNIKNSAVFPQQAIQAVLDQEKLSTADIHQIAVASLVVYPQHCFDYLFNRYNTIEDRSITLRFAKRLEKGLVGRMFPWVFSQLREVRQKNLMLLGQQHLDQRLAETGLSDKLRTHIEHHTCHARAAYHGLDPSQGREDALIFTLDGSGDGLCATVTRVGPNGRWERLATTPARSSLGGIYSNTTRYLGMKILEHEYKVMGLAPYSKTYYRETYERIFKDILILDPVDPLRFVSRVDTSLFFDYLVEQAIGERFDNIAGALQHLLEERVTEWIREAIKKTAIRRIFTSGGVFMNVKLNKRIQEMEEVNQAFFMPSCGDECNPIGAAYALAVQQGIPVQPLRDIYLGLEYSDKLLQAFIEHNGLHNRYQVLKPDKIEEAIAELLANQQVVGRFAGRCEWGARSLGNRAILAHPSHLESFYTVNDLIKARDFWMPFAPTILDTTAHRYLENYNPKKVEAPYMITAFRATSLGIKHLRAAMHQGDQTIRPQVLVEKANPEYYQLIQAFERRTGVGAVLNTSLNLHGNPLAATPEQALLTFENSGLRHLALGGFLLSKS